ncbi:hypothetical protein PRUPE_5G214800 [Prunus persica]|uniref:Protein kinase domain-containing protein n=1 Tax=Prunus persica TaxID=3760 RepID=A0A251PBV8_PRUPE|nr:hypothetical protein PRUPE_5G214800 [Prunus persica]
MSPKISDFELACIFQGTQNLANTQSQKVVGTLVRLYVSGVCLPWAGYFLKNLMNIALGSCF